MGCPARCAGRCLNSGLLLLLLPLLMLLLPLLMLLLPLLLLALLPPPVVWAAAHHNLHAASLRQPPPCLHAISVKLARCQGAACCRAVA